MNMDSITLLLVTFYIIAIILITVVLNIVQSTQLGKIKTNLSSLEKQKNQIVNSSILSELSKAETLVKNEKLEERYAIWQHKFEYIKNVKLPEITNMLLDADFVLEKKDYNELMLKIAKIEMEICKVSTSTNYLIDSIKEITLSEERNRRLVTSFKATYRELLQKFSRSRRDYESVENSIELQFENIEKRFQEFEVYMEKSDYDEINFIVKSLDEMIKHMKLVIEEVPNIVLLGKNIIPKRLDEVGVMYTKMTRDGYPLDFLNIEYNIKAIEKKVKDMFDKVRVLNLEDVSFELKTILDYLDSLFNDFEKEKLCKRNFEEGIKAFKEILDKTNRMINDILIQLDDLRQCYDLSEDEIRVLLDINEELVGLTNSYNSLYDARRNNSFSFSKLYRDLENLMYELSVVESNLDNSLMTVGSMQEDENRAREQLEEIKGLLKQSKYKIRDYKLTVIPSNYYVELKEAGEAIKEIVKELDKKPISIKTLNTRVDTARDLVLKLYATTNEMIKTAYLAETAIVYGNRYRSDKSNVNEGLAIAENLFFKGNYKKSLEISISTIDLIEPGIYERLLKLYNIE